MFTHTKANAIKLLAVARGWQPIRRGPPIWEFTPFHAEGQLCKLLISVRYQKLMFSQLMKHLCTFKINIGKHLLIMWFFKLH